MQYALAVLENGPVPECIAQGTLAAVSSAQLDKLSAIYNKFARRSASELYFSEENRKTSDAALVCVGICSQA